jgi:hypothetical protein
VNGHDTVLTWEQFDWKSGGGKEDLKNKLKLFSFVTCRSTVIIEVYRFERVCGERRERVCACIVN